MAKKVQLSNDSGTSWYTLPGSTGSFSVNAGELDDTVFGQDFSSSEVGLIGWTVSANGVYKGYAGYKATLKKQGVSTSMSGEAMSLVSGQTYQITATSRQILDRDTAITVYDNGVTVAPSNIDSIDYLFGKVTFAAGYSVTGPVTMDGAYFPVTALAGANQYTLQMSSQEIDKTDFATAQSNSGYRVFDYGLKTVSLDMSGFYDATANYYADLVARNTFIVEIVPDGAGEAIARGFFRLATDELSGQVGNLEEESLNFKLAVPDDQLLYLPFEWDLSNATNLNTALKHAINSWTNKSTIDVQYLHDGTSGFKGQCIIPEISLAAGLDSMNDFQLTIRGSGAITTV